MRNFGGPPTDGLPFFSLFYKSDKTVPEVDLIKDLLGDGAESYQVDSSTVQNYYRKEFGVGDYRRTLVFGKNLVPREALVSMKQRAEWWQDQTMLGNNRSLNIDPGHLYLEQVLLTTVKPYSHRIFLSGGVYAELVYVFSADSYAPLPWAYPDYASDKFRDIFNRQRRTLKGLLRAGNS